MFTIPRVIAMLGVLVMACVGIYLGAFWSAYVIDDVFVPLLGWVILLIGAAALLTLLAGTLFPGDIVLMLFLVNILAGLSGMAVYYGFAYAEHGAVYYGLFGIPLFMLPMLWLAILNSPTR